MKNKFFIIILLLSLGSHVVYGQNKIEKKPVNILYIIKYNSKEIRSKHLIISPSDIAGGDIPSKTKASKIYGPINEEVIMVIVPESDVKLLTLPMLYDAYKIDNQYRNFPVRIDSTAIDNANDLIADSKDIVAVNVNSEQKFINITTLKTPRFRSNSKRIVPKLKPQKWPPVQ